MGRGFHDAVQIHVDEALTGATIESIVGLL
jgi:hypothetical protein